MARRLDENSHSTNDACTVDHSPTNFSDCTDNGHSQGILDESVVAATVGRFSLSNSGPIAGAKINNAKHQPAISIISLAIRIFFAQSNGADCRLAKKSSGAVPK